MIKLNANFKADWTDHLRNLLSQSWDIDEIANFDDRDVRFQYFESLRRKLTQKPRILKIADNFQCTHAETASWIAMKQGVIQGNDLNPHLSTRHSSLLNNDGLLTEWGVHHFHLSTAPHPTKPKYTKRTGPLLFALVDDRSFCAINIYPHGKHWEDVDIVESIHRNWPEMIQKYRVLGCTAETLSKAERQVLRSKNANVNLATMDGTVYMPISGGVMSSGVNAESVRRADHQDDYIQRLQDGFASTLDGLIPTLEAQGYAGENEIEATLRITDENYQVLLPKYKILVTLSLPPSQTT